MKAHPAADLFPLLTGSDIEALAADVQTNGLLVPIVLHQDMILDGRNRFAACEMAGVAPSFVDWEGTGDPTSWVVSQNLHRRHLSESQRAMVAARLATLGKGRPETNASIDAFTQPKAAELLNVSRPSIQRASTVLNHGTPELVAAVDADDVSVSKAAGIARLQEEEQAAALEKAKKPHVSHNSGNNEWYTPPEYLDAVREVLGTIDLDPASCEVANRHVQADRYYTVADDGLTQEWRGRCFLNPPYSRALCGRFCERMATLYESASVTEAIVLVNNATETEWFQRLLGAASAVCFPDGRIRYLKEDGQRGAPLQGQAFIYFGMQRDAFSLAFRRFGTILFTVIQ